MPPLLAPPPAVPAWRAPPPPLPARVRAGIAGFPALLLGHRDLLAGSVARDLGARTRGSLLGLGWPFLLPLALFGVYYVLFTRFLGVRLPGTVPDDATGLAAWMFAALLAWSAFSEGLVRGTTSIVDARALVQKTAYPLPILPLVPVLSAAVLHAVGLAVFLVACRVFDLAPAPDARILWVPLLLLLQTAFTYGCAAAAASAHVLVRDTRELVVLLLAVGMLVTPIFWVCTPELAATLGGWRALVEHSPLAALVDLWRWVLFAGQPEELFPAGFAAPLARFAAWSLAALAVGLAALAAGAPQHADEV